jgi:hypothetical protein
VSPSGRSAKQTVFETLRTRSLGGATRWQPGSAARAVVRDPDPELALRVCRRERRERVGRLCQFVGVLDVQAQCSVGEDDTILVLVSDLREGGDERALCRRAAALVAAGVSVIELLARCRTRAPRRTTTNTRRVRRWAIPTFA